MFYETIVHKDETFLAGKSGPSIEVRLRLDRVAIAVVAVLVLVGLAIYASVAGWPDIAKEILKLASSVAAGFVTGIGTGEKRSARRISRKVRSVLADG